MQKICPIPDAMRKARRNLLPIMVALLVSIASERMMIVRKSSLFF